MHEDHRRRVRERFLAGGLQSFPPHNVLELLLFFSIPRKDTNETAHLLLERFGSLVGVLEASYDELRKVEGVGESTATLICLTVQVARRYLIERVQEKVTFEGPSALHAYTLSQFVGQHHETALLLCLDNAGRLLHCAPVSLGTKHMVSLDNRTLLETAFRHNATKVVLAHNHPNGVAAPSRNDVIRTQSAVRLFREVKIQLLDHLIIAGDDCFSMAAHPKFGHLFLTSIHSLEQCADVE
ncbi:MAG: DNA repair protein RadC [Oscillospiraceae bacterium]|jgi:DNA repair protein RadC|nr:DNA repair protein RadC [Oscillospiraceae bacterium]